MANSHSSGAEGGMGLVMDTNDVSKRDGFTQVELTFFVRKNHHPADVDPRAG
jgi:hypothetical protein